METLIQDVTSEEMPGEWKQGVIALIRKNGCTKTMENYRPIALLNITHKIWATIMTSRLKPIMNMLTNETHNMDTRLKNPH